MKVEDQVCTLDQAKKLMEFGVIQFSVLYWKCNEEQDVVIYCSTKPMLEKHFSFNSFFSAFTGSELGKMLANGFNVDYSTFAKTKGKYYVHGTSSRFDYYDTEAQARAAKLIEGLERDLITVEVVNARLIS